MIDKFGLWTYNDGWQVLMLVCVLFVAAGILMGILWNTKGLADELSGRKRKKELEYLSHRFAEMNVRSLEEVNIADPLSHMGESAPAPLTPAGGVFDSRKVQQPLGAGEVLSVGGVEVSQQQVAAIKNELLGVDDEPVTGFFTENQRGSVEEAKANEESKVSEESIKNFTSTPSTPSTQTGINPVFQADVTSMSQNASKDASKNASKDASKNASKDARISNIAPMKPAVLLVQANAERATGLLSPEEDSASESTPTGIFTPVEVAPKEESRGVDVAKSAVNDSSEGITSNLVPEMGDAAGVTTTFAPAVSGSAYRMEGAQFMGEIVSTGSYDPKTDTTKLEAPSGVDKATTGFLNN